MRFQWQHHHTISGEQVYAPVPKVCRIRLKQQELCDGFALAELDLELRGPGELLGTRQTGLAELRVVDDVIWLLHNAEWNVGLIEDSVPVRHRL